METRPEYPIEKARKILEADGAFLSDEELRQLVNVLTLLAEIEVKGNTQITKLNHEESNSIHQSEHGRTGAGGEPEISRRAA